MTSNADSVLQLGRELADALNPSDVIGRWMSHHLAELITRCEENPEDEALVTTTRDVVLKLWEHKSGASFQSDPYRYLQPLLRAISRLEASPEPWAFYNPFDGETPSVGDLSTYPLLRAALDIDKEVGGLIRLCVVVAAQEAISSEEPWVLAGKDTARTEEDRAVLALEQIIRRMKLKTRPDSLSTPNVHSEIDDDITRTNPDESATGEHLLRALQSAIFQCRRLLDQLAVQYDMSSNEDASTRAEAVPLEE